MPPHAVTWTLAAGLVLCALLALRPGWRGSAAWSGLFLVAQASVYTLVRSGPIVSYHHLRPALDAPLQRLALALLVLQAVLVGAGLARRRRAVAEFLGRLGPWRALLVVAALLLVSAKIARPPGAFVAELFGSTALHLVALGNLALAAAALTPRACEELGAWTDRWLGPSASADAEPGGPDRFALGVALAALLATSALSLLVYERHPHVPDEVVYLLGARTLAAGRLWLEAPPLAAAFDVDLMLTAGERWYSPVPIGWPLALAVGAAVGLPWLVNPVLTAAGVLLGYALVRELAPRRTARVAILLLAAAPWALFLGMSFMPHAFDHACTLAAALGVARARRTGRGAWGWLAGAAVGLVALVRPLDGLVLALLLGLWSVGLGGARVRTGAIVGLVCGSIAVAALGLAYNARMTGSPTRFPIMEYNDVTYAKGSNDLGFGPERGAGMDWRGLDPWPGHDPAQALVNAQFNAFGIDADLFGWATGSTWPILLGLLLARQRRTDRAMWAAILATVLASSFYYFAGGPDFGARYWYPIFLPCVWLTLVGLRALGERVGRARAGHALALLMLGALFTYVPWRCTDKYLDYRGMRAGLSELARAHGFGESLVLIRGRRHPDYASAAVHNPLDWFAAEPVYAWDVDDETRLEVLRLYADRAVWILDGPSETGAGFEVAEGPVSAAELIQRAREDLSR